jgi:hypothetical protein
MNQKMKFLLSLVVGTLMVLTVSAKATTADDQVCQANEDHVCFTKQADGSLAEVVTNGRGHAITREEDCEDTEVAVFYGCQPLSAIRAEEREECDGLGGRWYWSTTRGGRCVEQRPREREDDSPPPTPPPQNPPPYTPPTPPPPPGPGVTTPPGGGSIPPPLCPPTCPDCNCPVPPVGPDPCADVDGLAAELTPWEQFPRDELVVRGTDEVRTRVAFIRFRAGECDDGVLYARADSLLAAMEPPEPVPLPPDNPIPYAQEESCWDTWCPWVLGGAVVTVVTGVILGVICGTGGCDPVIDVYNRPQP